ncbi:hypothetical protein [Gracilibacillus suaedae]|uniref:hypothetical protein n=1 Tax=Gracilibacillus suaedae TaxID=2820273 RepID=UPI001ABEB2FF|nr:hypothetical protein [Gracilibacillus suaedae]
MKTVILTIASTLVAAYAAHTNLASTQVTEKHNKMTEEDQTDTDGVENFIEYHILEAVVDAEKFNVQVVENSNSKRISLLKDDQDQPQFKSIYVKDTKRLKVIDFRTGLVFNQIIADRQDEFQDSEAEKQETEIEAYREYKTLTNKIDIGDLKAKVVENNSNKRVIVLKENGGQPVYKSVYLKDTNRLKIINLLGGLIFNEIIE